MFPPLRILPLSTCLFLAPVIAIGAQPAHALPVGSVHLEPGVFLESQQASGHWLLELNTDRLLAPYYKEAGLPTEAENYGGWEEWFLPGVSAAFYLSGTSRQYALTGDSRYREQMETVVAGIAACQQARGTGLVSPTPESARVFRELEDGYVAFQPLSRLNGSVTPYYTLEKLLSGLHDAATIGGSEQAADVYRQLGQWLLTHMEQLSDEDLQTIMDCEFGGMNWACVRLYEFTGEERFLTASRRWHHEEFMEPLEQGQDALSRWHANTQFPKLSGRAARYAYTHDELDLKTARYFWQRVVGHHTFANGGNSSGEFFGRPDELSLRLAPTTSENCNSYNMLRLTQLLFEAEPQAAYADYMERVLWNHILAAQNRENGAVTYYFPLLHRSEKPFEPLFDSFKCCVASGMESYARHAGYVFARREDALYVNQYIPATAELEPGQSVSLKADLWADGSASLTFEGEAAGKLALHIRIPDWSGGAPAFQVNGEPFAAEAGTDGYQVLHREWRPGDVVTWQLQPALRVEAMPDDDGRVALFYGPFLLAGLFPEDAATSAYRLPSAASLEEGALQKLFTRKEGERFTADAAVFGQEVDFVPIYRVTDGAYTVYWDI